MPNPSAQKFKPIPIPHATPLPFAPPSIQELNFSERLSQDRLSRILDTVPPDFLSPIELDLLAFVLYLRQAALAWTDAERGTFSPEFFPDYEIPIIEHTPWIKDPVRVPKAIEEEVRRIIREQELAGKYQYSSAAYRSQMFPVLKKSGAIRMVLEAQPLNQYVIRDSALPPRVDDFAENFIGCFIYGLADLFSGFDARRLAEASRDLTTFHTIEGPRRLTVLPQGYCNSIPEFQRCTRHVLATEIPTYSDAFIDDVGVKGPTSDYDGEEVAPGLRRFVYEYATTLNRILLRFETAGITASGTKFVLATPKLTIVGTIVSKDGWSLAHGLVTKVLNWPYCESLTEVRGFLGTAGVGRKWIKGYSIIAKPLTSLCRKTDLPFEFGQEQKDAMDQLKQLVTSAPVLKKIDYHKAKLIRPPPRSSDDGLVVLSVDSSIIGSGWILFQFFVKDKHPTIFGSCTHSAAESRYSQPKVELYGVFRAMKELRHRLWGYHFRLEVDAQYLDKMIKTPDLPNAPMTRWISYIQLFDFEIVHVPASKFKGPDGLSRKRRSSQDSLDSDAEEFLDEFFGDSHPTPINTSVFGLSFSHPYPPFSPYLEAILDDMSGNVLGLTLETDEDGRFVPYTLTTLQNSDSLRGQVVQDAVYHALQNGIPLPSYFNGNINRHGTPFWKTTEDTKWRVHETHYDSTNCDGYNLKECGFGVGPSDDDPSPFHSSFLRVQDDSSYTGTEFFHRNFPIEFAHECVLGDELISLPFTEYRYMYMSVPAGGQVRSYSHSRGVFPSASHSEDGFSPGETSHQVRTDSRIFYDDVPVPKDVFDIRCASHEHKTLGLTEESIREVRRFYQTGDIPDDIKAVPKAKRSFLRKTRRFIWIDNRLWLVSIRRTPKLVVFEIGDRRIIMSMAHNETGHRGRDATFKHILDRFVWPQMYDQIAFFVRSCNSCQMFSKYRSYVPLNITTSPAVCRRFNCDTIFMPRGKGGMHYLLHASDDLSKWIEVLAARRNDAATWAKFIFESIICRFGCIAILSCDGGSEFKSVTRILLERYGVVVIVSSPRHPEGNGGAERDGQTIKRALIRMAGDRPSNWPNMLHAVAWAIRTTTSSVTGYTPYFLLFGQDAVFPFDLRFKTWTIVDYSKVYDFLTLIVARATHLLNHRLTIDSLVKLRQTRNRLIRARDYEEAHKDRIRRDGYPIGSMVLKHISRSLPSSTGQQWTGPYLIRERYDSGSYGLSELDGAVIRDPVAANRLKLFHLREDFQSMSLFSGQSRWLGYVEPWWTIGAKMKQVSWEQVKDQGVLGYLYWGPSNPDEYDTNLEEVLEAAMEFRAWR
ncbi:hypothetical protein NLI96_g12542 [Meripilus lineatus]|uniref:Integrase catalytic domain-containing protein n=1 Tax=Meripilus lineatus TaxID=2056292 RepID=A0AAD5UPN4_9APHY|nr:hypothetical protein NLI96_g12542 [Physisporinus lineatus]